MDDFRFYFIDQQFGWPGEKLTLDMPNMVNLRQDPPERTPATRGETFNNSGQGYTDDFWGHELWRFVMVQDSVLKLAQTAVEYPPMQAPASFNLAAVKQQIQDTIRLHSGD